MLTYYLFIVMQSNEWLLFFTLPIGIPLLWLIGFFIYVILHAKIIVSLILFDIPIGEYSLDSDKTKIYALRLSADNIGKYWIKSLEWIPYLAQLLLYSWMLKRYGVKIGKKVYIGTEARIDALPLVSIGESSFIGPRAVIGAHFSRNGSNLLFKPVKVGKRCFVGHNSVLIPDVEMQDDSVLGGYSGVLMGTVIPAGETWVGFPARAVLNSKNNQSSDKAGVFST